MDEKPQLSKWQIWWMAARPKTLPAAAAPVIAATALVAVDGRLSIGPAVACLMTALLLQIAANLANDVFDFQRGADTSERLGPTRVTQAGLLSPGMVRTGMWVCFILAGLLGLYVALASGWPILLVGIAAVWAALAYSGGPLPYGYYGLGEVGVFLFFGLAAVCGTYYAQATTVNTSVLLLSTSMGFLSTAILVVNNLRDIHTDRVGGKKTLATRFGVTFTKWEYTLLIVGSYTLPVILWLAGYSGIWVATTFLSIPLAVRCVENVFSLRGRELNHLLAETGRLELAFSLAFSVGAVIHLFTNL